MLTSAERNIMKIRKHAAINTLSFFKKIVHVRSSNAINPFKCLTRNEYRALKKFRESHPFSIHDSMVYTTRTGIGNCGEKASVCYTSLMSNPTLLFDSSLIICEIHGGDHGVVVINDVPLKTNNLFYMRHLRKTTMVVDGWSEDWYFPNLDLKDSLANHLANFPNPLQLAKRHKIKSSILICHRCHQNL
ncbi:MAG: hypothetical protein KAH18_05020 [Psychromonas sp.]|nr:hypothetical protein [Psychromonas sp.]